MPNIECQTANKRKSFSTYWKLEMGDLKWKISVFQAGQSLIEVMVAIGMLAVLLPALYTGLITTNQGKAQQIQREQATVLLKEAQEAVRSVRENGWTTFSLSGTYHPVIAGSVWSFVNGSEVINGFTRQIVVSNVNRDANGNVVSSGGILDPSTKTITSTVSWTQPSVASVQATMYVTRYVNNTAYSQTSSADFSVGVFSQTQVTNISGGEVKLANNNKAKWCSPAFASSTIDLPDGPPVAVAATASATSVSIPNDVFTAVAPNDATSTKLAYVNVTANTATPSPTLRGTFTLDASKYNAGKYPSNLGGLTNSFKTNDVKYYKSPSGKLYALLATDVSDHEVVAVQINDGNGDAWQDPVNHLYKYWTFFNTKQYPASAGNDQAPFGYGVVSLTILGNTGYVDSGGYLYTFDLSNIDTKTPTSGLDQKGCRILLDGYDCQPGSGTDRKYSAGQTGGSWGDTTSPAHNDCSDGGNVELYADHQLSAVQVGGQTYVYVSVGAGTNPELDIVDVSTPPVNANTLKGSTCGRGSDSGWKVTGSLDFDPANGTEEAANSVYAKSDGTRAYMSSNGGIIHNGIPDSDQFYIIDTSNKNNPQFLSTWASTVAGQHYANTAQTGYYNGNPTNIELYPRRALTVLNGQRAILVGQDGLPNDGIEPQEYQVLDLSTNGEANPTYCGGLNFSSGFNDLTSVSEADGDNFVYMVANTNQKQLKIIQGGPDYGIYIQSGTFISSIYNLVSQTAVNRFISNVSQPANTTIKIQVAVAPVGNDSTCNTSTYIYVGPDGTAGTYFSPNGSTISGIIPTSSSGSYQNPGRCLRYQVTLATTDQNVTPILNDITFNYSP